MNAKATISLLGCLIPMLGLAPGPLQGADNLRGADPLLEELRQLKARKGNQPDASDPKSQLRKQLQDARATMDSARPEVAARAWLQLAEQYRSLGQEVDIAARTQPLQIHHLWEALPPPTAWAELSREIKSRPFDPEKPDLFEAGLRLLAATLTQDAESRRAVTDALQARARKAGRAEAYLFQNLIRQMNQAILASLEDPDLVLKTLERSLEGEGRRSAYIQIPNLVAMVGPQKAEAFLRNALVRTNLNLHFGEESETARLAQKLALELIDRLTAPPWELVNSIDSIALYEALDKKFPPAKAKPAVQISEDLLDLPDQFQDSSDHTRQRAQWFYLLGLIAKNRTTEAIAVAKKGTGQENIYLPSEVMRSLERAGHVRALDNFFFELLSGDPTLSYWEFYVPLAAKAGRTPRMLELVRTAASRTDLSGAQKRNIQTVLFRALLAADEVEQGVAELKRSLAEPRPGGRRNPMAIEENAGQLYLQLALIGHLVGNKTWLDEGIAGATKALDASDQNPHGGSNYPTYGLYSTAEDLARLLVELNRPAEAEALMAKVMSHQLEKPQEEEVYYGGGNQWQSYLSTLAFIYHRANRPADVVKLLDQAPYWGAKDLAELLGTSMGDSAFAKYRGLSQKQYPLPIMAAESLASVGKTNEAFRISQSLTIAFPGYDGSYPLLLRLGGNGATNHLNQLLARDNFEERPLIWKAVALRDQKQYEAAESTVRQAIAIDPSDGEQGPDDRMRAYAVLADIREARGDAKEAAFFREVVKAIRLAEQADRFYAAGLLKRAVKMYQDSLKHFADAYCIQSRLALQLSELGQHDEAEAHYQKAYELMPDSFGRVESHCFGCEKAFEGWRAQGMAEKVFSRLVEQKPDKPQVHYLLGYLREEQERYNEALPHFRKAVQLDPNYLNAWIKLEGLDDKIRLKNEERQQALTNIIRLDPAQKHSHVDLKKATDLAAIWNALAAAQKLALPLPDKLYPLAASAEEQAKKSQDPRLRAMRFYEAMGEEDGIYGLKARSPGRGIGENSFVQIAGTMLAGQDPGE